MWMQDQHISWESRHRSSGSLLITITLTEGACWFFFCIPRLKNCWHGWGLNPKPYQVSLITQPLLCFLHLYLTQNWSLERRDGRWPDRMRFVWPEGKKLKILKFLGEIFQTQTHTKVTKFCWPDPSNKKIALTWPRSKNFDPDLSLMERDLQSQINQNTSNLEMLN